MTAPTIDIQGDRLAVHFDRFDLDSYRLFIKVKGLPEYQLTYHDDSETYTVSAPARFAFLLDVDPPGRDAEVMPLAEFLFDDQRAITQMAMEAKRFACWSDCGLGKAQRPPMLERFRHGQTQVLISRAAMLGYGMNFQHCRAMIFSGFNDSYEQFYQALRRAYRFGQTEQLRVHIPYVRDLEEPSLETILHKQDEHERAIAEMERNYIRVLAQLRPDVTQEAVA